MKVLYYDFEQGEHAMLSHIAEVFDRKITKVKGATENFFLRDSTRTIGDDMRAVPPPALLVLDSLQKIPTSVEFRRGGIDKWIHRLEAWKRQGYTVLAVSEILRSTYRESQRDAPQGRMGAFKESGEIEYAADFGAQMFSVPDMEGTVEFHIVKNRHRLAKGHLFDLERTDQAWWFRETGRQEPQEERQIN